MDTNAELRVLMGAEEGASFRRALGEGFSGLYELLARIDVAKAEAWSKDDQARAPRLPSPSRSLIFLFLGISSPTPAMILSAPLPFWT